MIDAGVPAVNLQGVLRTAGTREPLPGASIVVGERSAISGESGEFELFDVPLGEVKVVVTATGFERFEATELIRKELFRGGHGPDLDLAVGALTAH